jgi:SAM-dependent methyltransferase
MPSMQQSVNDLGVFYASGSGQMVSRILNHEIDTIWPDLSGKKVLSCGYTLPYLDEINHQSQLCIPAMFARQGATHWPVRHAIKKDNQDKKPSFLKNRVCLCEDWCLPFESNFFDHVLLLHALEHSVHASLFMKEVWRVLKSQGTALIIVSNRLGYWAKCDWTPFGQGTPYTSGQVRYLLHDSMFTIEKNKTALYALPTQKSLFLRTEKLFETCAPYILSPFAGVHVFEARKQLYVGVTPEAHKSRRIKKEGKFVPKPAYSLE